ncbi:MAG: 3-keto-5-aminohexanoate cleavage protein [Micromonosporaceae bacterium]
MLVKACLNGAREPAAHPRLPITAAQLAGDAQACAEFGAGAVHLHPRGADGRESLAADHVAAAVTAVRRACPDLPIGVTSGAWIVPDPEERVAAVASWADLDDMSRPDFASVNIAEPEWERVATALLDAGVGIEAGVSEPSDPARLAGSGLAGEFLRILVESQPTDPDAAVRTADTLLAAVTPLTDSTPLVHGKDAAAWAVLEWALDRELDSRIGLEDTVELPDGNRTPDNAALLAAAYAFLMEPH